MKKAVYIIFTLLLSVSIFAEEKKAKEGPVLLAPDLLKVFLKDKDVNLTVYLKNGQVLYDAYLMEFGIARTMFRQIYGDYYCTLDSIKGFQIHSAAKGYKLFSDKQLLLSNGDIIQGEIHKKDKGFEVNMKSLGKVFISNEKVLKPINSKFRPPCLKVTNQLSTFNNRRRVFNASIISTIEALDFTNSDIDSIKSLNYMRKLYRLKLSGTKVTDFSPLAKLKKLVLLDVSNTAIKNISFLKNFKEFHQLDISGTAISDLTPLSNIRHFYELYLNNSNAKKLKGLGELKDLKYLYLINSPFSDLKELKNMKKLKVLEIQKTKVKDFSGLKNLVKLEHLAIDNKQLEFLDVSENPKLQSLTVFDISLRDLSLLKKHPTIKRLYLHKMKLTSQEFNALKKSLPKVVIQSFK